MLLLVKQKYSRKLRFFRIAQSVKRHSLTIGSPFTTWSTHFFPLRRVQTGSWTLRVSCSVGTGSSFLETEMLGREAYQSPLSGAEVRSEWSSNLLSSCVPLWCSLPFTFLGRWNQTLPPKRQYIPTGLHCMVSHRRRP